MNKRILRAKESEIAKAGRLVFDALFGETHEFERNIADEIDRDAEPAVTVEGHGFVRCFGCAREKPVPAAVDVHVIEEEGWRFDGVGWRCPFCIRRAQMKGTTP
jgi:hypothetical protein